MEKKNVKKFYRSKTNKIFAGIIGGLGEYFEVDAAILRLFFILIVAITGLLPGIIAYFLALAVVPHKPEA